jgi:hypothetical protein
MRTFDLLASLEAVFAGLTRPFAGATGAIHRLSAILLYTTARRLGVEFIENGNLLFGTIVKPNYQGGRARMSETRTAGNCWLSCGKFPAITVGYLRVAVDAGIIGHRAVKRTRRGAAVRSVPGDRCDRRPLHPVGGLLNIEGRSRQ